jgi:hypothetical protein
MVLFAASGTLFSQDSPPTPPEPEIQVPDNGTHPEKRGAEEGYEQKTYPGKKNENNDGSWQGGKYVGNEPEGEYNNGEQNNGSDVKYENKEPDERNNENSKSGNESNNNNTIDESIR